MSQTTMIKVPFVQDNLKVCRCPVCPVQKDSACVKGQLGNLADAVEKNAKKQPQEVPVLYCNSGNAFCKDIEYDFTCICPTCEVYKKFNLSNGKPVMHYCRDGKPA